MRIFACLIIPLALLAGGCSDSIDDTMVQGPVDPGLYQEAIQSNQQRIAGEDHPIDHSILASPLEVVGAGYDDVVAKPMEHLWDYMTHDTSAVAARKMLDTRSADRRREGTLRLVDFESNRSGPSLKFYGRMATDADYTVRAAGVRALNRCRAKGYTGIFLNCLRDDMELVRMEAAKALANIPDKAAIPDLILHLQADTSKDVRIACADALRNFKTTEVTDALVGVLSDKEFSVAWQARQSLALMTGQDFRYDENAWRLYIARSKMFG